MKLRVVMDVDVALCAEEPDEDPEFTAELAERYGPEPGIGPEDVARVLTLMLGAPNGEGFQSIAIEEALFSHIESVHLISAETLPDPEQPALL